jgi:ligand-binding SRPBCC domain-containing protein
VLLTVEILLPATRAEVWAALSTIAGTNRELAPFVRMTDPTDGAPFDTEPWHLGSRVSWQLLLGVIPIDRHRIELVALPGGHGFRESSSTWWYQVWRHERALLDDPAGCVVRDSIEIEPRLRAADPIIEGSVRRMFRHRHRSLRRRFG